MQLFNNFPSALATMGIALMVLQVTRLHLFFFYFYNPGLGTLFFQLTVKTMAANYPFYSHQFPHSAISGIITYLLKQ